MAGNNYWKTRSLPYKPGQLAPFKLSRSKIELFMQCQRCFWLDVRLKITRPRTAPFNINNAIDTLFKKEFDIYRAKAEPHPIMLNNKLDVVPYASDKLDDWRENFVGVQALHGPTNLLIFGAVDDLWVNPADEIMVVDYKATSKDREVSISSDWQITYKRQMEIYQWLLRANDLKVSSTGYFVYTNGRTDVDGFYDKLDFKTKLIAYTGSDAWIEPILNKIKKCMDSDNMPAVGDDIMGGPCSYCSYARARTELTIAEIKKRLKK